MDITAYIESILGDRIIEGGKNLDNERYLKFTVKTRFGRKYFLKKGSNSDIFKCESNGLSEIAKTGLLRTPEVIFVDKNLIILEYIDNYYPCNDFFSEFGIVMARLHRVSSEYFGFYEDNFIGDNIQLNVALDREKSEWSEFYFNKRIMFQIRLCEEKNLLSEEISRGLAFAENRIRSILDKVSEKPSLLHGDLWNGNFLCDNRNKPVLIDPAVYYGHRETDLAMTKLFGGFHPDFYLSYNKEFPLTDGWREREPVYKLYHVLNHLNLFGLSYLKEAESLINYYICRELN
jgi:protein-ribulosamine 3-kinase